MMSGGNCVRPCNCGSQSLQGIRSFSFESKKAEYGFPVCPGLNPFKESGLFHVRSAGAERKGSPRRLNPFKESGLFHKHQCRCIGPQMDGSQSLQGIRSFSSEEYGYDTDSRKAEVSIPSRNQVFFIRGLMLYHGSPHCVSIPSRNQVFFMGTFRLVPASRRHRLNPFKESGLFHKPLPHPSPRRVSIVSIPSRNQVFFIKSSWKRRSSA